MSSMFALDFYFTASGISQLQAITHLEAIGLVQRDSQSDGCVNICMDSLAD
jgi:hypothetical protein